MSTPSVVTRIRSALVAVLTGLALILAPVPSATADEPVIDIPDPGFRACLSKVLRGAPLTAEALASFDRVLNCTELDDFLVENLAGAEHLTSARGVFLRYQAVTDLGPLRGLTQLQAVDVRNTPIASLEPLSGMNNLVTLNLTGAPARDFDALAELPALRSLTVGNRPVADLRLLDRLTMLSSLTVYHSELVSLAELALPPNLNTLTLHTPALSSLTGLEHQETLAKLKASDSKVSDLTPLAGLSNLTEVSLDFNQISSLEPLASLSKLQKLSLVGNQVSELTAIAGLSSLTDVNLYHNRIAELPRHIGLARGGSLNLGNNKIRDISDVTGITDIAALNLSYNEIQDISSLRGLAPDGTLNLSRNQILDFSALEGWTGSLSAVDQYIHLDDVQPNLPVPLDVRGPDGSRLTPRDQGSGVARCSHADGTLLCTRAGNDTLHFQVGGSITIGVSVKVAERRFTVAATPTLDADIAPLPGAVVTGEPGRWMPEPEWFSYQWWDGANPIPGATSASYQPGPRTFVRLLVTAHRAGYEDASAFSPFVSTYERTLSVLPMPTISGRRPWQVTDDIVTANPGVWEDGVTFTYQWQRNGHDIEGETSANYQLRGSDVGQVIQVLVAGHKPGYLSTTKFSGGVTPGKATFGSSTPTITGKRTVGSTLVVKVDWQPTSALAYEWRRNGRYLKDVTGPSYTLKPSDLGADFSVRVTAERSGYYSLTKSSSRTSLIKRGTLTAAKPTISGLATPGSKLTVTSTGWTPEKAKLTYRWYRDGKAIKGATSKTYKVKKSDARHKLTVRVTGKHTGYTTRTVTSSAVKVKR